MIDTRTEAVAVAICHALGISPTDPATPPAPGLPGLRWTQFIAAAQAARARDDELAENPPPSALAVVDPELSDLAVERQDRVTSDEVASIAARLINHEDPDVRAVAASALSQA